MTTRTKSDMKSVINQEIEIICGVLDEVAESPIECELASSMILYWRLTAYDNGLTYPIRVVIQDELTEYHITHCACLVPQLAVGKERYDFALFYPNLSLPIIIECDGHDFHERTKEQAKKDRSRDRRLQSKGYKVMRFTGSEIWASPVKCADEVMDMVLTCLAEKIRS